MNNKNKTGVYFDSIKGKKYLLVYDNGKLMSQSQMPGEEVEIIEEGDLQQ